MPQLTYDIGYYGVVQLEDCAILATDGNITIDHPQIFMDGIWGASWYNGAEKVSFATDFPTMSSQVGFQLSHGGTSSDIFKIFGEFCSSKRCTSKKLKIFPNGIAGYVGDSYCQSFSLETSQDSLVTGSFNTKSAKFSESLTQFSSSSANSTTNSSVGFISQIAPKYQDVYPYYGSCLKFGTGTTQVVANDLISWSINQSTQIVFQKSCNCKYKIKDVYADYIAFGLLNGDGSYSQIKLDNMKNTNKLRQFVPTVVLELKTVSGEVTKKISMHGISYTQQSQNVQTGSSLVQCDYSFTIIGDGANPLLKFGV